MAAGLSVVLVAAGGYWLLRTPTPPVEGSLPWSTAVGGAAASTTTAPDEGHVASPPAAPELPPDVAVHVAGAVVAPGVYELGPGARVDAAIERAGGLLPDADADALNLAAPVSDGSRLFVPVEGEEIPATVGPSPPVYADDVSAADATGAGIAPIDVNRADRSALEELPGIGPATADAIVTDRELNGPFVTVDDLDRVSGIGPAKIERLRGLVTT
jgi:competence protein ComEA